MGPMYDVVVVGAGPVGLAASVALARKGHTVGVLDEKLAQELSFDDVRASALGASSVAFLRELGLASLLDQHGQPLYRTVLTDTSRDEMQRPDLTLLEHNTYLDDETQRTLFVPNTLVLEGLLREAESAGVHLIAGRACSFELLPCAVGVNVQFRAHGGFSSLRTALVVGADGHGSAVRRWAKLGWVGGDDGAAALTGALDVELPHEGTAVQHFLSTGPLAFLPLPGRTGSFVWSLPADEAKALFSLPSSDFEAVLQEALGYRFGRLAVRGALSLYPLGWGLARSFVGPHVALLGDAAHRIHPLAGQGMNLGLADAHALEMCLSEARHLGLHFGSLTALRPYEVARRAPSLAMLAMCKGVDRFFKIPTPFARFVRGGLVRTGLSLPMIRDIALRQAAGV